MEIISILLLSFGAFGLSSGVFELIPPRMMSERRTKYVWFKVLISLIVTIVAFIIIK